MSAQPTKISLEELTLTVSKLEQTVKNMKAKQESHERRLHTMEVGTPPTTSNKSTATLVDTMEAEPTKTLATTSFLARRRPQPEEKWAKTGKEAYAWFQARGFINSFSIIGALRYILDKEEGYLEKGSGSKRKRSFADFQKRVLNENIDEFRERANTAITTGITECTLIQRLILDMDRDEKEQQKRILAIQGVTESSELQRRFSALMKKKTGEEKLEQTENEAENDGFSLPSSAFCAYLLEQGCRRPALELKKFLEDKREIHARLLRTEIPKIKQGPTSHTARNKAVAWLEKSFEMWKQGK